MISNYTIKIGEKINEIRTKKEMTLRDLSDATELQGKRIPHSSLMYYERGRSMDIDTLLVICKALNIDMAKLLDEVLKEVK